MVPILINKDVLEPSYNDIAAAAKSLQLCPTAWPHRRQSTRLLCPWDFPGKNTGVGCHFLLHVIILLPCLFNFFAEYFIWNAGPGEAQAGIKIAGRNINNLRYADDTTLMAGSKEELKSLLMKVRGWEMVGWYCRLNGHEFEQVWELVMDKEAWRAAIHGVTKSQTQLTNWTVLIMIKFTVWNQNYICTNLI